MFHVLTYKSAPQHEAREGLQDMFPQNSECAYQTVQTNTTCLSSLQESPERSPPIPYKLAAHGWRPTTCYKYQAGNGEHSATPQTLPPRKNLSLTERVPAVGLSPRPMGGVNAPENTQTVP